MMNTLSTLSLALVLAGLATVHGEATYNVTVYNAAGQSVPATTTSLAGSSASTPSPISSRSSSSDEASSRRQTSTTTYFSESWCGLVQQNPPAAGTYDQVVAEWTLPALASGAVVNSSFQLAQGVGIDGFTTSAECSGGLFGGTAYTFGDDGEVDTIYAWWEYAPEGRTAVALEASVGDVIKTWTTVIGLQRGTVLVENLSNSWTVVVDIDGSTTTATLCGATAQWLNENLVPGSEPYPQFDTFEFTDCYTESTEGSVGYLDGASVVEGGTLQSNGPFCVPSEVSSQVLEFTYSEEF
ncbi:hypothetical protein M406DRAFT_324353 [Cryphonectria parasitica EP155]|uniref:Uncharacterized protein n=1 Tax=Cryphonectria parasitica (strain ATCC 38755 / EP155) TaxID=660469 RepID=A0A9P5CK90_CRYP1|nr:uncharacterized protein M406DRAFT_324353 [Cryphonectria parasitica EP155]KAF3760505.1 hypothetical protein M406DRAFT_324353 [Cryphonectria parasitica EP155]